MGVVRCQDGQGQLSLGGGELDGMDRRVFGISGGGVGFLMLPEG